MTSPGVLLPVDVNIEEDRSPASKRVKYSNEIENLPHWSLSNELELHEEIDQGVKKLEPESEIQEDDTIFKKDRPEFIDVSCHSMSPGTRQKQIALLESTLTKDTLERLNLGEWSTESAPSIHSCPKIDYFELLSDEVILQIFMWIPKRHLMDVSLACKRFRRLVQDESLWTRMDVSNRRLGKGILGRFLSSQVIVLRLARSEILHPPILPSQPVFSPEFKCRLTFLDLSMASISTESLIDLFNKCTRLKKLSLEHVPLNDAVLEALAGNKDLEVINFAMATGIAVPGLQYLLRNCRKIKELNISWTYLTQPTIKFLCGNLPSTLDRLNLSGCRKLMCDADIAALVHSCPRLRELDLSDCTAITGEAVKQITALEDLNFLALSRCYAICHRSLLILKKMHSLSYLDIHGGYIDEEELNQVQQGLGARVHINKFKFSSIARPTVGLRRSSIWNIRVRE
ncbi:S-phase kinase-associated protein 2 [Coccinella septempunctata]|uniref:S-phase kinase-associated protein 2 n=1 Tax=Coccinella septempunctata TaxID=41139 RepID=UPI001D064588|nr:S-phase kinase-associated protein 2 [Coccinella septempunctata]